MPWARVVAQDGVEQDILVATFVEEVRRANRSQGDALAVKHVQDRRRPLRGQGSVEHALLPREVPT